MKNMNNFINERLKLNKGSKLNKQSNSNSVNESAWILGNVGTELNDKVDIMSAMIKADDMKKYGFLCWYPDGDSAYLMNFESAQDLRDAYGTDMGYEFIDEEAIDVGETFEDQGAIYLRIW